MLLSYYSAQGPTVQKLESLASDLMGPTINEVLKEITSKRVPNLV